MFSEIEYSIFSLKCFSCVFVGVCIWCLFLSVFFISWLLCL
jgi:hypothetical protein